MFVGDRRAPPGDALARVDHRPRQIDGFLKVHTSAGAGAQEGRDVQVGVTTRRDVADDRVERLRVEPVAMDLRAHRAQRIERRGVRHADAIARRGAQGLPCTDRHAGLAGSQQVGVHDVERRDDAPLTQGHFQARLGFEALGTADMAVAAHVDHVLLMRVDAERAQA